MPTLEEAADLSNVPSVKETHLPLPERRRGKVRDIYVIPAADGHPTRVLIVATDRVSAFDVVLPTPVPGKGCMLTDISVRWFDFIERLGIIDHQLLSTDPSDVPGLEADHRAQITGRVMIGRASEVIPVECVVRGYAAGSGWLEYEQDQCICGVPLPGGIEQYALGEPESGGSFRCLVPPATTQRRANVQRRESVSRRGAPSPLPPYAAEPPDHVRSAQ